MQYVKLTNYFSCRWLAVSTVLAALLPFIYLCRLVLRTNILLDRMFHIYHSGAKNDGRLFFHRCVSVQGGGRGTPASGLKSIFCGGVGVPQGRTGYHLPQLHQDRGISLRLDQGSGTPPPSSWTRTWVARLPLPLGWNRTEVPPPPKLGMPRTGYGMLFLFTNESTSVCCN